MESCINFSYRFQKKRYGLMVLVVLSDKLFLWQKEFLESNGPLPGPHKDILFDCFGRNVRIAGQLICPPIASTATLIINKTGNYQLKLFVEGQFLVAEDTLQMVDCLSCMLLAKNLQCARKLIAIFCLCIFFCHCQPQHIFVLGLALSSSMHEGK